MIRVRTLGECSIEVDGETVRPEAVMVFAVLLYLSVERGRRAEREALSALLWPRSNATRRRHNLRQILYKLNRLGVRVGASTGPLSLPIEDVWLDFEDASLQSDEPTSVDAWSSASAKALPGYAPKFSPGFRAWLDELRSRVEGAARRRMVAALGAARRESAWDQVERLARACLELDPLNEEGTLALAEAIAISGSKAKAIALLDSYSAELGPTASEARLPAELLKRRLNNRLPRRPRGMSQVPMIGRDADIAALAQIAENVKAGHATSHLVFGPKGIGKSRVLHEFARHQAVAGAIVISERASADDSNTPGLTLVRLFKAMLDKPGSLGLAPDVLAFVQQLTAKAPVPSAGVAPDSSDDALIRAVVDLQRAIAWEGVLIIILDDAQFADTLTKRVLRQAQGCLTDERVLVVLGSSEEDAALSPASSQQKLPPLNPDASEQLARLWFEHAGVTPEASTTETIAIASGGNPFIVREAVLASLGDSSRAHRVDSVESILVQRCHNLSDDARELFLTTLILGEHASVALLLSSSTLDGGLAERALVELESAQILSCETTGAIHVHSLWLRAVERLFPASQIAARRIRVAHLLELASRNRSDAAELLIASGTQFHRAGDESRASSTLARGGAAFRERALASAAHSAFSRAATLAPVADDLDSYLYNALVASVDAQLSHEAVGLLRQFGQRLRQSTRLSAAERSQLAVVELEVDNHATHGDPSIAERCTALLHSNELTDGQRLRVALLGAQVAEQNGDVSAVTRIAASAERAVDRGVAGGRLYRELCIVKAVSQGDLARAKDLAEEHIAAAAAGYTLSERARMLLNARIPFWFDSDFGRVDSLLKEVRSLTAKYPSTTQAFRIEDTWVTHCIDLMRLRDAEAAIAAAKQLAASLDLPGQRLTFLESSGRLRVAKGETTFDERDRSVTATQRLGRAHLFALSNSVILCARSGCGDLPSLARDLNRRWNVHRHTCPFDYPYLALAVGLASTGYRERGQRVWDRYAQKERIATNPPSPFIQSLAQEFGLLL